MNRMEESSATLAPAAATGQSPGRALFWAGIAATFAMALGTALTTGALAALAVVFKFAALRFAGGGSLKGARIIAGLEVLAAAFVAVLGAALFFGLWAAGQGS